MDTTLENTKKHIRKPAALMLLFAAIPVWVMSHYYFGDNYMIVMQICLGYMWLWFLGVIIYWHHKRVITSSWQYILVVVGLLFYALVVLFMPSIFSDAFTNLFWN